MAQMAGRGLETDSQGAVKDGWSSRQEAAWWEVLGENYGQAGREVGSCP